MQPIIIVGTGLAGYTLAREWRKLDLSRPLLMLTVDDGTFYSKPMLSNAISQGKTPLDLASADAQKMAADLDADIRTQMAVTRIDTELRQIETVQGEILDYHRLVLAVGAVPITVPVAGDAAHEILSVNNLSDYSKFRERLAGKTRVLIMGPGLIGCEFANDLLANDHQVTVVGPDSSPLNRLLPPQAGQHLQTELADLGVEWQLETVVEAVSKSNGRFRVSLTNGHHLEVDVILSAVGLRPNLELANAAGLKTNRGIQVDQLLVTSDPSVYALGDCAEVCGYVLPFVMPLMNSARALAKTLAGEPTPVRYPPMPVIVKTPACPIVALPPRNNVAGEWQTEVRENGVLARFVDEQDRLVGFALTGGMVTEKNALLKEMPPLLA